LLVALALIFARIFGYLFHRVKQPAVIGEIVAGIILGGLAITFFSGKTFQVFDYSLVLNTINYNSEYFAFIAEIGILFLLFISGLEIRVSRLKKTSKTSSCVAVGGVILPFLLGFISGMFLGFGTQESIVIGLILVATSVGVTARTLMDLDIIDTDSGAAILGGAVIDDVIGILLLAFAIGIESAIDAVWVGVRIAIFFLIFLYLGLKVIDKILDLGEKIHLPRSFLSFSLAILLIYVYFADKAGLSGIIGAFVAGVIIGQNFRSKQIEEDFKTIGYGFFIPLFFVWVGALLWSGEYGNVDALTQIAIISIVVITVSILGKIIGSGLGAKIAGMTNRESLQVGVGMVPRMEMALIIAAAAISHGFITGFIAHQILVVTILMVVITTLITPFLIKVTFKK
jgi:Kef-type K+ transport system membrane component KefB